MKTIKFFFTVMTVMLASVVSNAQVVTPVYPENINFSLVVRQQDLNGFNTSPNVTVSTIRQLKINNKDILNFLADAFHTNWPKDARLTVFTYPVLPGKNLKEICVANKDGQTIWNASDGYYSADGNGTNIAFFRINCDGYIVAGKMKQDFPNENKNFTYQHVISFELYRSDDADSTAYTDLNFQGVNTETYRQKIIPSTNTVFQSDYVVVGGDGYISNNWSVVSGKVKGQTSR